jgi:hypothetical protein
MRIREFALTYGVCQWTVREWVKRGKIRSRRVAGMPLMVLDPELLENVQPAPLELNDQDKIPLLRGNEVARMLGISTRRVRQLAETGKLNCRVLFRSRRYSVSDIRKIIAYRAARENLPNGTTETPSLKARQVREAVVKWAMQRLAS